MSEEQARPYFVRVGWRLGVHCDSCKGQANFAGCSECRELVATAWRIALTSEFRLISEAASAQDSLSQSIFVDWLADQGVELRPSHRDRGRYDRKAGGG